MARDPYRYFRIEARDLLDQIAKVGLELEKPGGGEQVPRLLRLAHTLKGAARVVKENGIADCAHAIEDVLMPWREGDGVPPRAGIDRILAELDRAESCLKALAPPEDAPAGEAAPTAEPRRSVRAEVADIDLLLDGVAETHALLGGVRAAAAALERGRHLAELLAAQLAPRPGAAPSGPQKQLFTLAEDLRRLLAGGDQTLGRAFERMERELGQLRDNTEQLRLVGAGSLFIPLERIARDAARTLGRRVEFRGEGGEIRLDAPMAEAIQRALVQIVRNAVAHGIETPDERRRAGKAEAGEVVLRVARQGGRIRFECADDGRGLDLDAVRRAAGAPQASAEEAMRLLLKGGISTSDRVTEAAGRGVGLDVVRDVVRGVGGDVVVASRPGEGTLFTLTVPPSLSALDALLAEVSGTTVCLPLESVRRCLRLAPEDFAGSAGGLAVMVDEAALPFRPLAELLGGPPPAEDGRWTAAVIAGGAGQAALGVDRLLGMARIVVHPLPEDASAEDFVAGASLDAEGDPRLVLDPDRVVAAVLRAGATRREPARVPPPILVIDDSLTTRMLERGILESAGYGVDLAASAEIALEMARARDYGLFLVDVEMPGMDGFAFIEHIRADPALHRVPAILVTSRAAPEDRERGAAAGAQGYVVKSAFDQAELLSMIRRLME